MTFSLSPQKQTMNIRLLPLLLLLISCQSQPANQHMETPPATLRSDTTDAMKTAAAPTGAAVPADQLIIPGERVGKTPLGLPTDSLTALLGPPDLSDAAMGKAWLTWNGKRDEHNNRTELNIYTTYKDNTMREKVVRQIRATSSFFKTKEQLGVYSSLEEIQMHFPRLKLAGRYKDGNRIISIYDAQSAGISFEVAAANTQQICTGVIVHPKGQAVLDVYMYFRPEVERVDDDEA
jgi:hypothetical protein